MWYVLTIPFGFELPATPLERAAMLENLLVARATGDMTASTQDTNGCVATLSAIVRVRDADRALLAALAEPFVSALRVTIPRARADAPLAGGSRSRVPPDGGAMLTLLRLPF